MYYSFIAYVSLEWGLSALHLIFGDSIGKGEFGEVLTGTYRNTQVNTYPLNRVIMIYHHDITWLYPSPISPSDKNSEIEQPLMLIKLIVK